MNTHWYAALLTAIGVAGGSAGAQSQGQVGFVFQVPVAIGVIWHATDDIAIRPEVAYATSTVPGFTAKSWTLAVNTPFYLSNHENVRTYISPRVGYTRSTNSSPTISSTSTTLNASGSFGVQYTPTRQFSLYAENGINYASATQSSANGHNWAPRSALGAILYFGK